MTPEFSTDFRYRDRMSKAEYVWRKYQRILAGSILDVGADDCHLRRHLPEGVEYLGIGFGEGVDQVVDLEAGPLSFEDGSFDVVLCLDVLEHIDGLHALFDELCRISRRFVIVSLPNPMNALLKTLRRGPEVEERLLKFYGIPTEPPEDRHRWFFTALEARHFVSARCANNAFEVRQIDHEGSERKKRVLRPGVVLQSLAWSYLFRGGLPKEHWTLGPMWAVLERSSAAS